MAKENIILKMAEENNGIITASAVASKGLSRGSLKYLADKGLLEKVSRGIYTLPDVWEDEFVSLQNRFKRGIFSGETVLYLCDLTDRTPGQFCMTFPSTYNLTKPKEANIQCTQAVESLYSMGIVDLKTPSGNQVKGYGVERTLCDILRSRNHTDIQIVSEAYKRYVKREKKDIPLLSEYARKLKVERRLRAYLEVLM